MSAVESYRPLNRGILPSDALEMGRWIGRLEGLDYEITSFGLTVSDAHNDHVNVFRYVDALHELSGRAPLELDCVNNGVAEIARMNLTNGLVEQVAARKAAPRYVIELATSLDQSPRTKSNREKTLQGE